jgi:hypothetical protein
MIHPKHGQAVVVQRVIQAAQVREIELEAIAIVETE